MHCLIGDLHRKSAEKEIAVTIAFAAHRYFERRYPQIQQARNHDHRSRIMQGPFPVFLLRLGASKAGPHNNHIKSFFVSHALCYQMKVVFQESNCRVI
jgi:hypothetical protein